MFSNLQPRWKFPLCLNDKQQLREWILRLTWWYGGWMLKKCLKRWPQTSGEPPSDDCPQQQCLFLSRESDLPSVMTRNMPQTMHFLCQTRKCILPQELLSYPYRATIQPLLSVHYCLLGSATKQDTDSLKHTQNTIQKNQLGPLLGFKHTHTPHTLFWGKWTEGITA